VIDYLQLIGFDARLSKAEGIAGISHKIKQIALDLNVSVILLAQVNREGAKRETGLSLYDLKDSGDIENDADVVLLMWPYKGDVESSKDKDYKGSYTGLFYKLAKNREGERDVGSYLKFYNCTGRFE
jgi:replicative DNA helicase